MTRQVIAIFALAFILGLCGPASAQSTAKLKASDEEFMSEMPLEPLPDVKPEDANETLAQSVDSTVPEKETPKKKQVYNPPASVVMPRSIQDDRIDDGYVQGLIRQYTSPHAQQ